MPGISPEKAADPPVLQKTLLRPAQLFVYTWKRGAVRAPLTVIVACVAAAVKLYQTSFLLPEEAPQGEEIAVYVDPASVPAVLTQAAFELSAVAAPQELLCACTLYVKRTGKRRNRILFMFYKG